MECAACEVRSSIGYCIECHKLLCEMCSTPCEQCGKLCCDAHTYETRSGRQLCTSCYGEREEKRARVKAAKDARHTGEDDTSFGNLEGATPPPEEEGDDAALVASGARATEPWKISVVSAVVGLAVMLLVIIVPSFRAIPMGSFTLYTPLILVIIPLMALFWGVYGFFREEHYENRPRCLAGVGMASLTILMAVVAVYTAPVDPETERVLSITEKRDSLGAEEMDDYREEVLRRYQQ